MTPLVARFMKDEWGTTAIEDALIAVGISVAIFIRNRRLARPDRCRLSASRVSRIEEVFS